MSSDDSNSADDYNYPDFAKHIAAGWRQAEKLMRPTDRAPTRRAGRRLG